MTMTKTRKTHTLIALALITSFTLSACGIRGSLKTPPPVWGEKIYDPSETSESPEPADTTDNSTPET